MSSLRLATVPERLLADDEPLPYRLAVPFILAVSLSMWAAIWWGCVLLVRLMPL